MTGLADRVPCPLGDFAQRVRYDYDAATSEPRTGDHLQGYPMVCECGLRFVAEHLPLAFEADETNDRRLETELGAWA